MRVGLIRPCHRKEAHSGSRRFARSARGGLAAAGLLGALAAASPAQAACEASAGNDWKEAGVRVLARVFGPNCADAVAVIVVRGQGGALLHQRAFAAASVMTLAGVNDGSAMGAALKEWTKPGSGMSRTGQLPDWPQGADAPAASEFPFYPAQGVDRDFHNAWRADDAPMFCYVQGMESASCIAVKDGAVSELGVQSFPG
jgi:hypothetical protein